MYGCRRFLFTAVAGSLWQWAQHMMRRCANALLPRSGTSGTRPRRGDTHSRVARHFRRIGCAWSTFPVSRAWHSAVLCHDSLDPSHGEDVVKFRHSHRPLALYNTPQRLSHRPPALPRDSSHPRQSIERFICPQLSRLAARNGRV